MILTRATQILDEMQWENMCLLKKKHETQDLRQWKQKYLELSQIGNNERKFSLFLKRFLKSMLKKKKNPKRSMRNMFKSF